MLDHFTNGVPHIDGGRIGSMTPGCIPAASLGPRDSACRTVVVGIDVGGHQKGFHAVALTNGQYSGHCTSTDTDELADWCSKAVKAEIVGVDAPCKWSTDGLARPAERQLMAKRIWCFSTPTRQRAVEHPTGHYGWMLQGENLFNALRPTHPVYAKVPAPGVKCSFETFPHAIAWHLTGGQADASRKRVQRPALLAAAGINLFELKNEDLVDAALCAFTAHLVATGVECTTYGEPSTGLIIVPTGVLTAQFAGNGYKWI